MEIKDFSLNIRGRLISLSRPVIMGILNVTPDSFFDGGMFTNLEVAMKQTEKMLKEGALIIDIGAQSTRPGAECISAEEEKRRIGNLVKCIKKEFPEAIVSVDTFYSEVVYSLYQEGIDIINDISGGQFDDKMFSIAAKTGLPYVLMHCNSQYAEMHKKKIKEDIILELNRYFSSRVEELLKLGVKDIILDPGFGFGKSVDQQHQIIEEIEHIAFGDYPLLIGISGKSFIYKPLDKNPHEIDEEIQSLHVKMLRKGVKILRVHNVAKTQKTIDEWIH